eukprot:TRINITY_DN823_c0_g4_i1.p1 TRINITY_DN823_c0_g4~~TRINITY_DN823_c0_g4_i1.p1  ORF type:complete len:248 (+),score=35.30 TRINITY_DN823_c0_g4_i1:88-831(+)
MDLGLRWNAETAISGLKYFVEVSDWSSSFTNHASILELTSNKDHLDHILSNPITKTGLLAAVAIATRSPEARAAAFELLPSCSTLSSDEIMFSAELSALAPPVWKRVSALLVPIFGSQRGEVLRPWCAAVAEPSTAREIQAIAAIECLTFALTNSSRSAAVLNFLTVTNLWRSAFSIGAKYLVSTQDNILSILEGIKTLAAFCLDQIKISSDVKKFSSLFGRLATIYQDLFIEINLGRTDVESRPLP